MICTQVLSELTAAELSEFVDWLRSLPFAVYRTGFIYEQVKELACELEDQSSMRRMD